MRKAFILLLFIFAFLYSPKSSLADSNFTTDYKVIYTVSSNANTHVDMNASLINLTDKYYASSYSIQVGFTDIRNLQSYDSEGAITPKVEKTANGSTISITFNRSIVGLNNKNNFNISFDTAEIAENLNNTWNINIPGVAKQNNFSSFNVSVIYPSFLGTPTYIKPVLLNGSSGTQSNILTFSKDDLGSSGISIAFGNFQVYNFNLDYNLANTNIFPITTEIALPPSTNYQDITIDNIFPKPLNVKTDKDGNWLATYAIKPSQKYTVKVSGEAKAYLFPKQESLDPALAKDYLKQDSYWEVNNKKIKEIASNLKTPYAIYQYVVDNLNYDFSRVQTKNPRLGALAVLNNPSSAVCLEFTDLFIALARAAGIPAREIDGYAYTSNTNDRPLSLVEDILHAWPEYYDYDKKAWIMVDPTWGNTTKGVDYFNYLDFNHIAFIVKGKSSTYPIPAGGYKFAENVNQKDVSVKIGSNFDIKPVETSEQINIPNAVIAGIPVNGYIKISNKSNSIVKKQDVSITTKYLYPKMQSTILSDLPPYGYIILPLELNSPSFLTNAKDTVKITLENKTIYKNIEITPLFLSKFFIFGGIIFVSICIIISLASYAFWRIFILRRKESNNLRWKSEEFKK